MTVFNRGPHFLSSKILIDLTVRNGLEGATMKTILLLPFVLAFPAFAGTSAKEVIAPAPAPSPCLFTWFAGGSVGYLTEFEEPMYNLHIGTDTCWNIGGWNVALFAEIGYTEKDEDWSGTTRTSTPPPEPDDSLSLDDLEDTLAGLASFGKDTSYDLDIMPITANVKFERPLSGNLNAYFGGGLGAARVDLDIDAGVEGDFSDDDWVFTAQIFAGLNYNVTPDFEIYGGARWIYYSDADLSDGGGDLTLDLDDDFLFELGGRFNF
jgi:opacity protein-like surface antigen